jgi:hypothetical protein
MYVIFSGYFIYFPKKSINHVQIYPNIGIRTKHNINIYQNNSESKMGINGEDMVS